MPCSSGSFSACGEQADLLHQRSEPPLERAAAVALDEREHHVLAPHGGEQLVVRRSAERVDAATPGTDRCPTAAISSPPASTSSVTRHVPAADPGFTLLFDGLTLAQILQALDHPHAGARARRR